MKIPVIDMAKTGARLQELRKKNKITAEQIMWRTGVGRDSVYKWLGGKGVPKIDNLVILADMFHTKVDDLVVVRYEEIEE